MLRFLYREVVRLHPSAFRNRFGDEMLSIFDNATSTRGAITLLGDGLVSLGRQWLGSPRSSNENASVARTQPGFNAVPSFLTLDSFHPQTIAILDGLVLSVALFCLTCFAIRYSWIRVLHIRVPEVQAEPYLSGPSSAVDPREGEKTIEAKRKETDDAPTRKDEVSAHLQVEPLPVEPGSAASAFESTTSSSPVASSLQVQPLKMARPADLDLHSYEGIYVCSSPHFMISVTTENGNLAVRIENQPTRTISSFSATTFVINGTDDRIEFDQDKAGVIYQLRLLQGDRQYAAERQ